MRTVSRPTSGFKFGFGLVLGGGCAAALFALVLYHPKAILGGAGILLAVILGLVMLSALFSAVSNSVPLLPTSALCVIAGAMMMGIGWTLAHGTILGLVPVSELGEFAVKPLKVFGWLFLVVGASVAILPFEDDAF